MKVDQSYVLVQMTGPANPKLHPAVNALAELPSPPTIKRIIRTYHSDSRAEEDRELLAEMHPECLYAVLTINHIDN